MLTGRFVGGWCVTCCLAGCGLCVGGVLGGGGFLASRLRLVVAFGVVGCFGLGAL